MNDRVKFLKVFRPKLVRNAKYGTVITEVKRFSKKNLEYMIKSIDDTEQLLRYEVFCLTPYTYEEIKTQVWGVKAVAAAKYTVKKSKSITDMFNNIK